MGGEVSNKPLYRDPLLASELTSTFGMVML